MDSLSGLMGVLNALAAMDIGADGRPGEGYGALQAWAGWELSAEAVPARAAAVVRAAPELVAAAIEKAAGGNEDLQALARQVEARVAADRYGEGICTKAKAVALGTQPLTE
jgi:hypothetical protein